MIYGYARVSGEAQELYGSSLVDQIETLESAGAQKVYSEQYTGTKIERPVFSEVINLLKPGDTLVVTKLDRLARTAGKGIQLVEELLDRNVRVQILNMGTIENTSTGKLMMQMLLAFAEFERNMIFERTQEGKRIARLQGRRAEGRKKKVPEQFGIMLDKVNSNEITVTEACKVMGICRTTFYKLKEERKAV